MIEPDPQSCSQATLYTVGHSNRTLDELMDLLQHHQIEQLIDVRSQPHSRRFPFFNRESLQQSCRDEEVAYHWLGYELGGLRREQPNSPHMALSAAFRGYADHMGNEIFGNGIKTLSTLAQRARVAIMCAEREPSQCHRNMIADYLALNGWRIIHIIDNHSLVEHTINPLVREVNKLPVYDLIDQEQLNLFV